MVSNKIQKKMMDEALERMNLLGINSDDIAKYNEGTITKVSVDHESGRVIREDITDEEMEMINSIQEEKDFLIFYCIKDEGVWPDGCKFPRYTFPVVTKYVNDYALDKEDAIGRCHTLPAYIVNLEDDDCSEYTEFRYHNVNGLLINVS